MTNRSDLIYAIDEFVYDLQYHGAEEEEIFAALKEYLEIYEDLSRAAWI